MSPAINQSFLDYCASYAGIDGGDDNAEYWFIGIDWSDTDDITIPTDGKWCAVTEYKTGLDLDDGDWKLEKDLDNLYKLLPHCPTDQIFAEDSNSFKLNLFPIPFKHDDEKELWDKNMLL